MAEAKSQVYSPHTAIDAAAGGLGDWLADIVTGESAKMPETVESEDVEEPDGELVRSSSDAHTPSGGNSTGKPLKRPVYLLQHHPSQLDVQDTDLKL